MAEPAAKKARTEEDLAAAITIICGGDGTRIALPLASARQSKTIANDLDDSESCISWA